jgi:hypothetical protein
LNNAAGKKKGRTMNPFIQLKKATSLFLVPLACFVLSPLARAVNPPPDGGYPGQNTAEGDNALFRLTTGTDNTAMGFDALYSNTIGTHNTAIGSQALLHNTRGTANTAVGSEALLNNSNGAFNTATGWQALFSNTAGGYNTANGYSALLSNTTGFANTGTGHRALANNTMGIYNTATGEEALGSNSTGARNTATGWQALISNTTGNGNTAAGSSTLLQNSTGNSNTAGGNNALFNNSTGSFNIAVGNRAGFNLTTGSDNIDIGNEGRAGESGRIRIGTPDVQVATFIAGVRGVTVPSGMPVVVGGNAQLGTMTSSARFKDEIKPMNKGSEAILALKPVTFRYKREIDPDGVTQFGLVAEDVEKVNPDLVARDADGKPYMVRYEAVNAMLLNEFLKEHRKVENLKNDFQATVAQQQKEIAALAATVKEQAAQIQKVSAQLEAGEAGSQIVLNNQ